MRKLCVLLALLLPQSAHPANDPATLLARLNDAQKQNSLDDPALKPWHLRLAVTLIKTSAKTQEDGTIEEWWQSPSEIKVTYDFPSFKATFLRTGDSLFKTKSSTYPPVAAMRLLEEFTNPLPPAATLAAAKLTVKTQKMAGLALDCIQLNAPQDASPKIIGNSAPAYCLDPGDASLRLITGESFQDLYHDSLGRFQNRTIPTQLSLRNRGELIASARVTQLSTSPPLAAPPPPDPTLEPIDLTSISLIASKTAPVALSLPFVDHTRSDYHTFGGKARIEVTVGPDGHVVAEKVESSTAAEIGIAAQEAAKNLLYRPYRINCLPVQVQAPFNIQFDTH